MRRLLLTLGVGVLLTLSHTIQAADGDTCDSDDFTAWSEGTVKPVWCVLLCDGDTANGACSDFNLRTNSFRAGIPDQFHFMIGTNDCTTATATFGVAYTSGGPEHGIGTTTAVVVGGTTRITLDNTQAATGRIIATDLTNVAGCTNGVDILLVGYEVTR